MSGSVEWSWMNIWMNEWIHFWTHIQKKREEYRSNKKKERHNKTEHDWSLSVCLAENQNQWGLFSAGVWSNTKFLIIRAVLFIQRVPVSLPSKKKRKETFSGLEAILPWKHSLTHCSVWRASTCGCASGCAELSSALLLLSHRGVFGYLAASPGQSRGWGSGGREGGEVHASQQ